VIRFIAVVFLLVGCSGNRLPPPVSPSDRNARILSDDPTRFYTSDFEWQRTPWYRIDQMKLDWPIRVVVSNDGFACFVDGGGWAMAQPRQLHSCAGKWIQPRYGR